MPHRLHGVILHGVFILSGISALMGAAWQDARIITDDNLGHEYP